MKSLHRRVKSVWEADGVQALGFALMEVDGLPSWDQGFAAQLPTVRISVPAEALRAGGVTAVLAWANGEP